MPILSKNQQVNCTESEYYKFLGYVANHPEDIKIVWEKNKNSGAWENEDRIQFLSNNIKSFFPTGLKLTADVGNNIESRLNCNELFTQMSKPGFVAGSTQPLPTIRTNIPTQYQNDFDIGSHL